jgi:tetratricopeptide (TPR) repeat protein
MKQFIIIIIFSLFLTFSVKANEQQKQLEKLFNDLKINNFSLANSVEQKIWKIWSTHPNSKDLTMMLTIGSDYVNNQKFDKAVEIFSNVIDLDPSWAEAWNKRATVYYMVGEFEKSQADINKVLELESRHFGALAGQGLVNIELENYEKAIKSYQQAQEIYPSMQSPKIMIEKIKKLIKKQSV